ncbi:hypothetical protein L1887_38231 [Cichorium endivia]|nr:hypothetical protein L1887_38231 [Cichorium endivia]
MTFLEEKEVAGGQIPTTKIPLAISLTHSLFLSRRFGIKYTCSRFFLSSEKVHPSALSYHSTLSESF